MSAPTLPGGGPTPAPPLEPITEIPGGGGKTPAPPLEPIDGPPGGGPTPAPPPVLSEEIPVGGKITASLNTNGHLVLSREGSTPLTITPEQLHALFLQASIDSEPRKATALEGQATAMGTQAEAVRKHALLMERLVEGDVGYTQATDEQVILSLLIAQAGNNVHGQVALSNALRTLVPFRARCPLKTPTE